MIAKWICRIPALMATGFVVLAGCGGSSDSPDAGELSLKITDMPIDDAEEVVVVFSGVLFHTDGRGFIGTADAWWLTGPALFYLDYWIHQGEFPLWNNLILCGLPAGSAMDAFDPANLVRSLLTPSPTPFRTHVTFSLMLAA